MDKTNGRVQILDGRLFFSPNCSHTVDHPPSIRDENGGEPNPFFPNFRFNGRHKLAPNYFDLDTTKYASPRWWTSAFDWISFFPLTPSLSGPVFEKLFMPRSHRRVSNEDLGQYFMPSNLLDKWLRVGRGLSDAIFLIRHHYPLPFLYPTVPEVLKIRAIQAATKETDIAWTWSSARMPIIRVRSSERCWAMKPQ
jgi:hypothetical protein